MRGLRLAQAEASTGPQARASLLHSVAPWVAWPQARAQQRRYAGLLQGSVNVYKEDHYQRVGQAWLLLKKI